MPEYGDLVEPGYYPDPGRADFDQVKAGAADELRRSHAFLVITLSRGGGWADLTVASALQMDAKGASLFYRNALGQVHRLALDAAKEADGV